MVNRRYITAEEFGDFGKNQEKMIEVLNHSLTKLANAVTRIEISFAELLGGQKVLKKIVWWILGIITFIVGSSVLFGGG